MENKNCPCGSGFSYYDCCDRFISGDLLPETALELMKSRYSAYATKAVNYIFETTHPSVQHLTSVENIQDWADETTWLKLEIVASKENIVEFKATYKDLKGNENVHHERSNFHFENNKWYYVDGNYYD